MEGKEEIMIKTTQQESSISASETNVDRAFEQLIESKNFDKWCPHHRKLHPPRRCWLHFAFSEKTVEDCIPFLKMFLVDKPHVVPMQNDRVLYAAVMTAQQCPTERLQCQSHRSL